MEVGGPSRPSNYVTILDLKERWLQQQQSAKSNTNPPESDSQLNPKPKHESASKIPNESVPRTRSRNRIINQPKPDVTPHNSDSKTPNEGGRNRHRIVNQVKPEVTVQDSAFKTVVRVADKHPIVEKKEHNSDKFNSKHLTTKNGFRGRNPRFVTDKIPTGGSPPLVELEREPEPEPERVQEKKQEYGTDQSNSKLSTTKKSSRGRNAGFVTDKISAGGRTAPSEPESKPECVLEEKTEYGTDQSNSKHSKHKNSFRNRNPRFVTDQIQAGGSTPLSESELERVQEKKQEYDTDQSNAKNSKNKISSGSRNPRFVAGQNTAGGSTALLESEPEPVQEYGTDGANSKLSTNKNSYRNRNPRFATDQISTGGSTPEKESEPVQEKKQKQKQKQKHKHKYKQKQKQKQHQYGDRRRVRNQEPREPRGKMPARAENVEELPHNGSGGDGEFEAVTAAVKEISVVDRSQRINGRWGSGSFIGGCRTEPVKPPFGVKRGQTMTAMWVKKVESVPN